MDVLESFRRCVIAGESCELVDDTKVVFPSATFDKNTPLPLVVPTDIVVTPGALWCLLTHPQAARYIQASVEKNLPKIPIVHHTTLLNYIRGTAPSCPFLTAAPAPARAKRAAPSAWTAADVLAEEVSIASRASALHVPGASFKAVGKAVFEKAVVLDLGVPVAAPIAKAIKAAHAADSAAASASPSSKPSDKSKDGKSSSSKTAATPAPAAPSRSGPDATVPIIVVPGARTALLNIANAPAFFAEGKFVEASLAAAAGGADASGEKPRRVSRVSEKTGKKSDLIITAHPEQLTDAEWARVVAVVASGPAWQLDFKRGTPVDIFAHALGVYPQYEGDVPHANIAKWGIARLQLSRTSRHKDSALAAEFWRMVKTFLASRANSQHLVY